MAVEAVTLRARLIVEARSARAISREGRKKNREAAAAGKGELIYGGERFNSLIYKREELTSGACLVGPGLVVEPSSTILLPPGSAGVVDEFENIMIEVGGF